MVDVERATVTVGKYDTASHTNGGSPPLTVGGTARPTALPTGLGNPSSRGVASAFVRPAAPVQRESTVRFDTESFRPKQERRATPRSETPQPSPNASVGNLDEMLSRGAAVERTVNGRSHAVSDPAPTIERPAGADFLPAATETAGNATAGPLRVATTRVPTIQVTGDPDSPSAARTPQRPSLLRRISSKLSNTPDGTSKGGQSD